MGKIWYVEESGGGYDSQYTKPLKAYKTPEAASKACEAIKLELQYVLACRSDMPKALDIKDFVIPGPTRKKLDAEKWALARDNHVAAMNSFLKK